MEKLQIVYLPPGDLKPYEKNARKHAPDDIEAIKKSILEDGFNDPIGIWGENNVIVEGHGRQIAATELGWSPFHASGWITLPINSAGST